MLHVCAAAPGTHWHWHARGGGWQEEACLPPTLGSLVPSVGPLRGLVRGSLNRPACLDGAREGSIARIGARGGRPAPVCVCAVTCECVVGSGDERVERSSRAGYLETKHTRTRATLLLLLSCLPSIEAE